MLEMKLRDPDTKEILPCAYLYPSMDVRDFGSVSNRYYEFLLTFAVGKDIYFVPSEFFEGQMSAEDVSRSVIAISPSQNQSKVMDVKILRAIQEWFNLHREEFIQYNMNADTNQRVLEGCIVGTFLAHLDMTNLPSPQEWLEFIANNTEALATEDLDVAYDPEGGYAFFEVDESGEYNEELGCKVRPISDMVSLVNKFVQPPELLN